MSAGISLGQFADSLSQKPSSPVQLPGILSQTIAGIVLADIRNRFTTQTDPRGQAWVPLARQRPNGGGSQILLDTGVLRNSIQVQPTATGVVAFSNLHYAAIHNFGGVIRAQRTKFLSIPLTREAKRAGSPRRFPGKLQTRMFTKTKGVMFVMRSGKKIDQFLLVKSVKIPQREFMGLSRQGYEDIAGVAAEYGLKLATDWMTQFEDR